MPTHVVYVGEPYDRTVSSNHDGAAGAFWGDRGYIGIYNTQTNTHASTYSEQKINVDGLIHGVNVYTPKTETGGYFQLESYEYPTHVFLEPSNSDNSSCWFENRDESSSLSGVIYLSKPDGSVPRLVTYTGTLAPFIWGDGRPREDARLRFNANGYDIPNGEALKGQQLALRLDVRGLLLRNQAKMTITTAYSYTPCGAPGSIAVPEFGAPNVPVTVSWSEGAAGIENAITGYEIQRRDSLNGIDGQNPPHITPGTYVDSEWTSWTTLSSSVSPSSRQFSANPNPDRGKYAQFRVRTRGTAGEMFYSGWIVSAPVLTNILPDDPSGTSASPSLWESGNVSVGWTQAPAVTGNCGVTGYEIGALYSNGTIVPLVSVGGSSGSSSVTQSVAMPSISRGEQIKFGVRTVDALSETSDWVWSGYVKRNSRPESVTGLTASPSIYESTSSVSSITVRWTASTDPDGNLVGYIVRCSVSANGSAWGEWITLGNSEASPVAGTSYSHSPDETVLPRGNYIRYQITPVDALGAEGVAVVSARVYRNRLPLAPTFVLPILGSGTSFEGFTPAFKLAFSADPDGHAQYLCIRIEQNGATVWQGEKSIGTAAGTACIRVSANVLSAGMYDVYAWVRDPYGRSASESSMSLTIAAPSWTRTIVGRNGSTPGTVISDASQNIRHTLDITEMVAKANAKRAAYGLEVFTKLDGTNIAVADANGWFVYWQPIMTTIVSKVRDCYLAVDETPPTVTISNQYPSASAINQVRSLIAGA